MTVTDFRTTLSQLNMQFSSLELEAGFSIFMTHISQNFEKPAKKYRKVVRENSDLRRQIAKLEARVKLIRKKSKKSKTSFF